MTSFNIGVVIKHSVMKYVPRYLLEHGNKPFDSINKRYIWGRKMVTLPKI